MFRLFTIGVFILIIAIIANFLAIQISIKTWYNLLSLLNASGSNAIKALSIVDYLWLFICYPLVLGIGYWIGDKIYKIVF